MEMKMDLLRKVDRLEIRAKGLTRHLMSGEYHSAFKGRGMIFSEVRSYQFGDDVRTIDWNVTARFEHPYVKVFEEDRELVMMFIIDVSASQYMGSVAQSKQDVLMETFAILAFAAISNNDKIGVIFVSDRVERYIPPKKGKKHLLTILHHWMHLKPKSKQTNMANGLKFFHNTQKKRSICFLMSDFLEENSQQTDSLKLVQKKHDLIALKIEDPAEYQLPKLGFVQFVNAETKQTTWVNATSKKVRMTFEEHFTTKKQQLLDTFKKNGIDYILLNTTQDNVLPLITFFRKRSAK